MKLRDIYVKAFRLFDEEHIEFVNERFANNGCADFVTIYAPNGFGKTSLFDAIEFGMTKNIKRLKFSNFKENVESDKKLSDMGSFIHNKKKPDDIVTIKLGLEGHDVGDIETKVNKNDERSLLISEPSNKYFSKVMLAQDWFSEFLSAQKAESRFKIFMENFYDSEGLLDYHAQLKTVSNKLKSEIKGDSDKKKKKANSIKNEVDENIMDQVDKMQSTLNELLIEVSWKRKIEETYLKKLNFEASRLLENIEKKTGYNNLVRENCQIILTGQDGLIPVDKLDEACKTLQNCKKRQEELKTIHTKIIRLKALTALVEKLNAEKNMLEEWNKVLSFLIEKNPVYRDYLKQIDAQENIIIKHTVEEKLLVQLQGKYATERTGYEGKLTELKKELLKIGNSIKEFPARYAQYEAELKETREKEQQKSSLEKKLIQNKQAKESIENRVKQLTQLRQAVKVRNIEQEIDGYNEKTKRIVALTKEIESLAKQIEVVDGAIKKQISYKDKVEELLLYSKELIDAQKKGVCPLCGHDYHSTDELLKSIEANKAISETLDVLGTQKVKLHASVNEKNLELNVIYTSLNEEIGQTLYQANVDLTSELTAIKEKEKELGGYEQRIKELKKRKDEEFKDFSGLTREQIEKSNEEERIRLSKQIEETDGLLKKNIENAQKLTSSIEGLNAKTEDAKKIINEIKTREDYLTYEQNLNGASSDESMVSIWKQKTSDNIKLIGELQEKVKESTSERKILEEKEQITIAMEAQITNDLAETDRESNNQQKRYSETIQFIHDKCGVTTVDGQTEVMEIVTAFKTANENYKKQKELLDKQRDALQEYQGLLKLAGELNEQRTIKKEIEELGKQIEIEKEYKGAVDKEIVDLENYLDRYVRNFFQVDLINKLYNQIDPHPDYKKIEFNCDFKYQQPRLNVFMGKKDENEQIVPNLYFSTAQVNILSFCIFMAKALFAKNDKGEDLGCIFIDDPIQALDDINILSMIDLLRNVAFSLHKQVILTTHDQNFFELLQKKIPQDKFNACYLKAVARGKFERVS